MSEEQQPPTAPTESDAEVTVQPSISTEEAAETDVELSPVGDEAVEVPADPPVEPPESSPDVTTDVTVRSASKREIDVRLLPWDTTVSTRVGMEEFAPGSFAHIPDDGLLLMGLEHEAGIGVGQAGQPVMTRRAQGRSIRVWEGADGPYATFRVAKTQGGDDIIALADERVIRGVSVEMDPTKNIVQTIMRGGRRVSRIVKAAATAASLTYRPTYGEQAAVLAVRSQQEETAVAEDQEAPVTGAVDNSALLADMAAAFNQPLSNIMDRLEKIEERARSQDIVIPGGEVGPPLSLGEWTSLALKGIAGDRLSNADLTAIEQVRALDDVITSDNLGVVPTFHVNEVRGVIDTSRPFLASTRRLPTPPAGIVMNVPVITQRPTTAVQATEKTEVDSTKTLITSENFDMVTIAGAGDLSIQIIKRSSPSFLELWLELLSEAYAIDAEDQALRALFNETGGGITAASPLDPENLLLGDAFQTSFNATRRPPNTLWLSTEAIAKFIDAKASGTNAPLYPGLEASATAAGGITGNISGLRVVHVPQLDSHGAFAVVGPSSGFAWAEDGTYTLQADKPDKAGRDVGIVGMMWFIPWYPAAFTLYNVAS